jgi:hypothetical protein
MGNITPANPTTTPWMNQNVPNMKYVAYANILAGAQGMVAWLTKRGCITYANQGDLSGYMSQLQQYCYLGCVGNTDPSNNQTITQGNYTAYQSGISGYLVKLASVTPDPPSWWSLLTTSDQALLAAGGITAAAVGATAWYTGNLPRW